MKMTTKYKCIVIWRRFALIYIDVCVENATPKGDRFDNSIRKMYSRKASLPGLELPPQDGYFVYFEY